MSMTYKAIITGDRVQWLEGAPPEAAGGVRVEIAVVDTPVGADAADRGAAMAAALQKIADGGGISSIPDPVEWQREMRKDRVLYGREE